MLIEIQTVFDDGSEKLCTRDELFCPKFFRVDFFYKQQSACEIYLFASARRRSTCTSCCIPTSPRFPFLRERIQRLSFLLGVNFRENIPLLFSSLSFFSYFFLSLDRLDWEIKKNKKNSLTSWLSGGSPLACRVVPRIRVKRVKI